MKLAVVGCTTRKRAEPSRARDLYDPSVLFRTSLAWAERFADRVVIVSAKYGLLELGQEVAPYQLVISDLAKSQRLAWGRRVAIELRKRARPGDQVVFLCGRSYYQLIVPWLGAIDVAVPFKNDRIGRRMFLMAGQLKESA